MNKADIGTGIDVQGKGSYVILPPSMHPDTGRRYDWDLDNGPDDIAPQRGPAWLEALVTTQTAPNGQAHGRTAAEGPIPEGGRESHLVRVAGAMRAAGTTVEEIRATLEQVNQRCQPPLAAADLDRLARSVGRYLPDPVMWPGRQAAPQVEPLGADAWKKPPVWAHAITACELVAQQEVEVDAHAKDLIVPGCITVVSAPRASGKSLVALYLAVALAKGGVFRGEQLPRLRVLLVDRDNPPSLIRKRLRWLGAHQVTGLKVLTREMAPPLTDKTAWGQFPAEDYEVVIIDSLGAATEGVSEKEGRETQEFLATLKDLASRGPALLCLDNTTKSAMSYRGRGEKGDAVDILYECRNITGWMPSQAGDWWEGLPDFGEHTWQQRATRRKGQAVMRVAFVPSKFRLAIEPEAFVLEIDTRQEPWTLADVTATVATEGEQAAQEARHHDRVKVEQAEQTLVKAIAARDAGEPMLKSEAEDILRGCGLKREIARALLEKGGNHDIYPEGKWVIRPVFRHRSGKALGVYLYEDAGKREEDGERSNVIVFPNNHAANIPLPFADGSTLDGERSEPLRPALLAEENDADLSPQPGDSTAKGGMPLDE
jgi:hypothetical protein